MAKLRERGVGDRALEAKVAGGKRKEPRDLAQQAGLAGAVRPGDQQRFAGRKAKAQVPKRVRPPRWQLMSRAARPIACGICSDFAQVEDRGRQVPEDAAEFSLFASLSRCRKGFYIGWSAQALAKEPSCGRDGGTVPAGTWPRLCMRFDDDCYVFKEIPLTCGT